MVSYGVLHHIPDPRPVMEAARRALRPGGRMAVWIYGREGNEAYLALAEPVRALTTRLPHAALSALAWSLTPAAQRLRLRLPVPGGCRCATTC